MNYIQRFFPFTVSERSEEGKLFQGQQEKVSGLSRKILVLARVSEKFRSPHSFTKIYKKRHYSFGKKGPKWIDLYIPKLVKKGGCCEKYIRNEEYPWPGKEAGENVKKKLQGQRKI